MRRREFMRLVGAGAISMATGGCARELQTTDGDVRSRPDRPNVLLILSDQHRSDTMGFKGQVRVDTPHMDRLAGTGVSFDRCITPNPLCTPARCAIFSGLYPHQARGQKPQASYGLEKSELGGDGDADMLRNNTSLREQPLLMDLLRERGYFTGYAGKWHLGSDTIGTWFDRAKEHDGQEYAAWCVDHGLPDGKPWHDMRLRSERFPHMSMPRPVVNDVPPEAYEDAWIADHALRILDQRPGDQPFFMVCGFEGPHPPFKIPEPYYSMYDAETIEEPPNFRPTAGEPRANSECFYRLLWQDHGTDWTDWQKPTAVYRGFVTLIDDQIGRIVDYLRQAGELVNTLIIYASDHGEMLGQHGLWHKMHAYEESLRVPLVFSAPWLQQTVRSDAQASLIDLAPTICGQTGVETPGVYEGVDLLAKGGEPTAQERYLFSEFRNLGEFHKAVDWRMVTDNRFKYTWNRGDRDELYDLTNDVHETQNLIANPQHQATLGRLREELAVWMKETEEPLLAEYLRETEVSI